MPPIPTPINGFPTFDDDSPNYPPISFDALYAVLDSRVVPRFASVAERDAAITAPVNGMFCWTADAGIWLRRSSAWALVLYDTGWVNITTVNSPFVVGSNGAKYRIRNGHCTLSVHLTRNTSNWTGPLTIFTLPTVAWPAGMPAYCHTVKGTGSGDVIGNTKILTNGVATFGFNGSTGDDLSLSGNYPVA